MFIGALIVLNAIEGPAYEMESGHNGGVEFRNKSRKTSDYCKVKKRPLKYVKRRIWDTRQQVALAVSISTKNEDGKTLQTRSGNSDRNRAHSTRTLPVGFRF